MFGLKQIEKPEGISEENHQILLQFLGRLYINNESIKENKNLFCYEESSTFKLLDESLAKKFKQETTSIKIRCKAMAEYFMGNNFEMLLIGKGRYLKGDYKTLEKGFINKYYIYPFFEDMGTVSDNILYMWYDLFEPLGIQIVNGKMNMYYSRKPMDMFSCDHLGTQFNFEFYLDYPRDKLLEKEIELGYTNKIIGDESRGYGYTHLLRANIGEYMVMPSSAIRLIMNWGKYNTYLTSRKQGKTSFAADRVVAELLSEKKGYGMRKSRRIKFFTDNASKVGREVMEYIKDFLGDMKNKEIKPGIKYFEINDSSQEVRCNLTGNVFNVISLAGLKGDSDNSTGDGLACDCAIIDEGFRIIERFWRSFKDRAFEECDWMLFISTLNEETEITHWGYKEMIKGEAGHIDGYNTVRSSDFDNTITYFNNFKMQGKSIKAFYDYTWNKLMEKVEDNGEPYALKRILCGIITEKILFNISGRLVSSIGDAKDSDFRVIGIDPGGKSDHLGVCIFNTKTLIVEETISVHINEYTEVLDIAKEYKNKYKNSIIVGDLGGPVGETVYILDKDTKIINYWLKTNGNIGKINDKKGYFVINKGVYVLNGADCLQRIIKLNAQKNSELIKQFGDMETKKSQKSKIILYEAKSGKKDDAVFAFLNVMGLLRMVFELKKEKDIIEFGLEYNGADVYDYEDEELSYYGINPYYY